jgi:hypothetical protein
MSKLHASPARSRTQTGYAILLVLFLATLVLLMAMAAAPNVLTQGRREKEKEMIWRGNQYVRGIKLYYRKMGHFPTSLDDLTKPQMGEIRFMRKAYKDPMNTEDGSWRLIYVGPAGQLIGSLRPPQNLQMPGALGTSMGIPASTLAGGQNPFTQGTPQTGATSASPGQGNAANTPGTSGSTPDQNQNNDMSEVPTGETPTVIGGNIIGVGSKVNHASIITYEKAKNYKLFEFIWDPSKDPILLGGTGAGAGAPANPGAANPGQSPFGMGMPPVSGNPNGGPPLTTEPAPPPSQPPSNQNPPSE